MCQACGPDDTACTVPKSVGTVIGNGMRYLTL